MYISLCGVHSDVHFLHVMAVLCKMYTSTINITNSEYLALSSHRWGLGMRVGSWFFSTTSDNYPCFRQPAQLCDEGVTSNICPLLWVTVTVVNASKTVAKDRYCYLLHRLLLGAGLCHVVWQNWSDHSSAVKPRCSSIKPTIPHYTRCTHWGGLWRYEVSVLAGGRRRRRGARDLLPVVACTVPDLQHSFFARAHSLWNKS